MTDIDDDDALPTTLAAAWSAATERARVSARQLARYDIRELFRFARSWPRSSPPPELVRAIDTAAQALLANVDLRRPELLGRLLLELAPLLDPRSPLRAFDDRS